MTFDQFKTCLVLDRAGWTQLPMPESRDTPIPGLALFSKPDHREVLMVLSDGRAVDLMAVYHAAEDCVRNWHEGSKLNLPHFVGDFGRLNKVCAALNGFTPLDPRKAVDTANGSS